MLISTLIAQLAAIKEEHGDLHVVRCNDEGDWDDLRTMLDVRTFVPSGNRYCGGDWAEVNAKPWEPWEPLPGAPQIAGQQIRAAAIQ